MGFLGAFVSWPFLALVFVRNRPFRTPFPDLRYRLVLGDFREGFSMESPDSASCIKSISCNYESCDGGGRGTLDDSRS
jgi:hypothetical protein